MIDRTEQGNVFRRTMRVAKHNAASVFVFSKLLEYLCRDVESYVFVANSGRCGSVTLSKIFETVEGGISLHEPAPVMFNDYASGTDRKKYFRDLFYKKKRIYVNTAAKGHRYYFETNHQFVKNFIDPAVEYYGERIRILHLVRDPVSVASSFYQVNTIPGQWEGGGVLYLIDPRESDNIISAADLLYGSKEFSHDIYKCLWYWYEVEARTKAAKLRHGGIPFYRLKTEELNDPGAVLKMFKGLAIEVDPARLNAVVGVKANTRTSEKVKRFDKAECAEMNEKLLFQLEKRYGKDFWA